MKSDRLDYAGTVDGTVNAGLEKTLGSNGQLTDVDTAVVAGLRAYVRF